MIRNPKLLALSAAAMALPIYSQASTPPDNSTIGINSSTYRESNTANSDSVFGSLERYDVDVHQFYLNIPAGSDFGFNLKANREIMSGASPTGTVWGENGDPALIMSGATIKESRTEVQLTVTRYRPDSDLSITYSRSEENDYVSNGIILDATYDFNNQHTTWIWSLSYSDDEIEPTDAEIFGRVIRETKDSVSFYTGVSQVLNKHSVIQFGLSTTHFSGYLSDPYRDRDIRPDNRTSWVPTIRYRHFSDRMNAAIHINYRYYHDDFGIRSHTLETSWHQNINSYLQVVPSIRYYSQEEADFFTPVDDFTTDNAAHQSSDFRLSSYGAISFGLAVNLKWDDWSVTLYGERYLSDGDYGLTTPDFDHPALIDFTLLGIGLNWQF